MGGIHAIRDNKKAVKKQVRFLENRLEQANIKFNKTLSKNKVSSLICMTPPEFQKKMLLIF